MPEGEHGGVEELRKVLEVVGDKVPNLLNQLRGTLFSAEAGRELGRAVGAFYKELVEAGIPHEEALAMAKDYISSMRHVIDRAGVGHHG